MGKVREAQFIANLGQMLDEPTIKQIAERMAAVQGYRFRMFDDRLFLLKAVGESQVKARHTIEDGSSSTPELTSYLFVRALDEGFRELMGMPVDDDEPLDVMMETIVVATKVGVAANAAADHSYLQGHSVLTKTQSLVEEFAREASNRALAALAWRRNNP